MHLIPSGGNLAAALVVLAVGNVGLDIFGCVVAAQLCMTRISPWAAYETHYIRIILLSYETCTEKNRFAGLAMRA
jgi:hypothetical protein